MERWEYRVVLVNIWGRAMARLPTSGKGTWQFDGTQASDLVTLFEESGSADWDLIGIDTNASYAEGNDSYVRQG